MNEPLTDLKQIKERNKAKNVVFRRKLKTYALVSFITVLVYYSSLYSFSSDVIEQDTIYTLCIGTTTEAKEYKCPIEFTARFF